VSFNVALARYEHGATQGILERLEVRPAGPSRAKSPWSNPGLLLTLSDHKPGLPTRARDGAGVAGPNIVW